MSVLNTEEISNPDIRLYQTRFTPICQIYREAMFTTWSQSHMWPEWALDIRYGRGHNGTAMDQDPMKVFNNQTKLLEQFITDRIGQFRIEGLDNQIKYYLNLLFVDVELRENKYASGTGYLIYNRRTGNPVMSVIMANLGL